MSKSQKKSIAPAVLQPIKKAVMTKKVDTENDRKEVRRSSKQGILITLLERSTGATVDEMAKATGWQDHSVLGTISGVLRKRLRFTVESIVESRGRVYRIAASRK